MRFAAPLAIPLIWPFSHHPYHNRACAPSRLPMLRTGARLTRGQAPTTRWTPSAFATLRMLAQANGASALWAGARRSAAEGKPMLCGNACRPRASRTPAAGPSPPTRRCVGYGVMMHYTAVHLATSPPANGGYSCWQSLLGMTTCMPCPWILFSIDENG